MKWRRRRFGEITVADRNMNFIGRDDPKIRIVHFPPPLVTHHAHLDRIFGHLRVLDLANGSAGHQHEHHGDEDGNHRPRQLNVRAAVNLRRLSSIVVLRTPKFHDAIDQYSCDEQKDDER